MTAHAATYIFKHNRAGDARENAGRCPEACMTSRHRAACPGSMKKSCSTGTVRSSYDLLLFCNYSYVNSSELVRILRIRFYFVCNFLTFV